MCDLEDLEQGDAIEWWDDGHSRGVAPDAEGAVHRTGVVASLVRRPDGTGPAVAAFIDCPNPSFGGTYTTAIVPAHGHRPEIVEKASHATPASGTAS